MSAPVPYRSTIRHARTEGVRHRFRYRHTMWLVDLDDVPVPPRRFGRFLPRFDAADHFGDPHASIRANVERYLAANGVDGAGSRIVMLTNPRSLGYVFNPITVYWCYSGEDVQAIVAEVHNTWGERHCYLLEPDIPGRTVVEKQMYVSPFFAVDGTYDMRFDEPAADVHLSITMRRDGSSRPVFSATLDGRRRRVPRSFVRAALRRPAGSLRVIALIHWQALQLWLRRQPIITRPLAPRQEHVS